jgi:hypothetical protein
VTARPAEDLHRGTAGAPRSRHRGTEPSAAAGRGGDRCPTRRCGSTRSRQNPRRRPERRSQRSSRRPANAGARDCHARASAGCIRDHPCPPFRSRTAHRPARDSQGYRHSSRLPRARDAHGSTVRPSNRGRNGWKCSRRRRHTHNQCAGAASRDVGSPTGPRRATSLPQSRPVASQAPARPIVRRLLQLSCKIVSHLVESIELLARHRFRAS